MSNTNWKKLEMTILTPHYLIINNCLMSLTDGNIQHCFEHTVDAICVTLYVHTWFPTILSTNQYVCIC